MADATNSASPRTRGEDRSAFTLVELLVVIGIIALLIALLLPSLAKARKQAQRTACAAKLHNMMLAAQMHRQEHADYYPLAGILPGYNPPSLDDQYAQKYDYYYGGLSSIINSSDPRFLCPITYGLLTEMAGGKMLNGPSGIMDQTTQTTDNNLFLDPRGLNMNFICPAQATSPLDIQPKLEYLWLYPPQQGFAYVCQPQSYIYNEFVLGWNDNIGYLRGKGSLVHQAASTMFAADGLGGSTLANHPGGGGLMFPMYTVYPNTTNPTTLAQALTAPALGGLAGDKANFDLKRHDGRMNIAFFDGHVESRNINAGDLNNVWIEPP